MKSSIWVDWDAFFDKFEASKLAFLYQDKTAGGKMSRFHKVLSAIALCVKLLHIEPLTRPHISHSMSL
jgi:hypothetical protein